MGIASLFATAISFGSTQKHSAVGEAPYFLLLTNEFDRPLHAIELVGSGQWLVAPPVQIAPGSTAVMASGPQGLPGAIVVRTRLDDGEAYTLGYGLRSDGSLQNLSIAETNLDILATIDFQRCIPAVVSLAVGRALR